MQSSFGVRGLVVMVMRMARERRLTMLYSPYISLIRNTQHAQPKAETAYKWGTAREFLLMATDSTVLKRRTQLNTDKYEQESWGDISSHLPDEGSWIGATRANHGR